MVYRSAQTKTKGTTYVSVMNTAAFNRGVKESRSGKPFDYDAYPTTNEQWAYERGRQFGLIYSGPVKNARRVTNAAVSAMHSASMEQIIF